MEEFNRLRLLVNDVDLAKDVEKCEKGIHAAGVRVRAAMQEIKAQAQSVRGATSTVQSVAEEVGKQVGGPGPDVSSGQVNGPTAEGLGD